MTACRVDPCQHSGRLHVARTAANIDKVKDLELILLKVSVAN